MIHINTYLSMCKAGSNFHIFQIRDNWYAIVHWKYPTVIEILNSSRTTTTTTFLYYWTFKAVVHYMLSLQYIYIYTDYMTSKKIITVWKIKNWMKIWWFIVYSRREVFVNLFPDLNTILIGGLGPSLSVYWVASVTLFV